MTFKFDTKETFMLILPEVGELDANMADNLIQDIKLHAHNGTNSFIVDLSGCTKYNIDTNSLLLDLHDIVYNELEGSLVFTNLSSDVFNKIKQERLHLSLNITPTYIEAVDIVNMEILERDILNE